MKVKAKIVCTKKFSIEGKSYVTLQGVMNEKGMFCQTVREDLVPDHLEGTSIELDYDIGIANNFKPYLKLQSIKITN